MKNLFYTTLFLFSTFTYGQIIFEKGYIIDNNREKKEVLIKNYEWKNNPNVIEYKINEGENPSQIKTSDLQEFFVGNQKYVSAIVMIDRSSNKIESLSTLRDFNHKEEKVLLKLIVEGKTNLYKYSDGSIARFFYKKENEETFKSLDYKEYLVNNTQLQKNEEYKTTLSNEFSDNEKITAKDINKLSYKEDELKKIFQAYDNLNEIKTKNGNNFHIYIKPGIGFSNYEILPPTDNLSIGKKKENSIIFRAAIELEYILNFNKGKWAVISEPSFQAVKFSVNDYNRRNFEINYSSIQIPAGLKFNMFINQKSKFHISGSMYYNLILNKKTFSVDNDNFSSADGRLYPSFAAGYNYDKFGFEIKWGAVPYFVSSYYGQSHNLTMDGFNLSVYYKLF